MWHQLAKFVIKNRFIWSSASNRGLDRCIEYMKEIKKSVPDATLYVYRDVKDMSPELVKTMNDTDFIFFKGALDNKLLVKEFHPIMSRNFNDR